MKNLLITLIGAVTLGAALPAIAGPDFQQQLIIQNAIKAKQAQTARVATVTSEERCATQQLILPVDHGPRAQTTPYLNQQRKARFEAEMKACKEGVL